MTAFFTGVARRSSAHRTSSRRMTAEISEGVKVLSPSVTDWLLPISLDAFGRAIGIQQHLIAGRFADEQFARG